MAWVKLDDGFWDNAKVAEVGVAAAGLYLAGLCWSARNLTDGLVPYAVATKLCRSLRVNQRTTTRLVVANLWKESPSGYYAADYLDYNPSRAKVLATRARWAQAKTKPTELSTGHSTVESTVESTEPSTVESRETPSAPFPLKKTDLSLIREIVTNGTTDVRRERGKL